MNEKFNVEVCVSDADSQMGLLDFTVYTPIGGPAQNPCFVRLILPAPVQEEVENVNS